MTLDVELETVRTSDASLVALLRSVSNGDIRATSSASLASGGNDAGSNTGTLARTPLFSRLSRDEIARIDARCHWRKARAGAFLVYEHNESKGISILTRGRARMVRIVNGREIILRDIFEGEYFGYPEEIPNSSQVVAVSDSTVARMPAKMFRDVLREHPSVCEHVLTTLSDHVRVLSDRFSETVALNLRARLCAELLRLSRRTLSHRFAISPPPTHFEIAARLGTGREAVTKLLIGLERDGLISRNRSAIALTNCNRLETIAAGG
jgi:CRP/FNR family cyclic AMP-dependent transcriptional regulator